MNWKNIFIVKKIRYLFDWTPLYVKIPKPRYEVYSDAGKVLLGYEVEVKYLHHGVKKLLFPTEENKLGLVSRKRALEKAINFYKTTRTKINLANQKNTRLIEK